MRKSAAANVSMTSYYSGPQLTIDAIAIQLESGVIEHEVDATARVRSQVDDCFPQALHVVAENILFRRCEAVAACRLQRFDLLFRHVDEK